VKPQGTAGRVLLRHKMGCHLARTGIVAITFFVKFGEPPDADPLSGGVRGRVLAAPSYSIKTTIS